MKTFDLLVFAFMVLVLIAMFRNQIIECVWKVFYSNLSDEKLEKIVRKEYEAYELNRRAYNDDGLNWLLQMAQHLQAVWKAKSCSLSENSIFSYWKEAEKQILAELNRRKYFNSLT